MLDRDLKDNVVAITDHKNFSLGFKGFKRLALGTLKGLTGKGYSLRRVQIQSVKNRNKKEVRINQILFQFKNFKSVNTCFFYPSYCFKLREKGEKFEFKKQNKCIEKIDVDFLCSDK